MKEKCKKKKQKQKKNKQRQKGARGTEHLPNKIIKFSPFHYCPFTFTM